MKSKYKKGEQHTMKVLCEVSVRHIHMRQEDVEALYGKGATLEFERALSQPGEYLSKQRVTLVGPKREMENVAVLGPVRKDTQVELSRTDCFMLGIKNATVRQSGDVDGTPGIILRAGTNEVTLTQGVIIAKRHIHLDPATAEEIGVTNNEIVNLAFEGDRAGTLGEVIVRVSPNYLPGIHLDTDEGNAMFAGDSAEVIKIKQ
jgi:putative phosphotransacetylase